MRIGIIGSGNIVRDCLDAISQIEEIELKGICVRKKSLDKGEVFAKQYNIPRVYTEYEEILSAEDIDVIYIGILNSLHFEYVKKALEQGKHVICEKPFTSTFEEMELLYNLAKNKNLLLFEAVTILYSSNYKYFKEKISEIGNIKMIQCNFSQYSSRYDKYLAGEVMPAFDTKLSGGALYDINVYNLHFVMGIFGKPKFVKYYANIGYNGIDTSGVMILSYENFDAVCVGAKDSFSPNHVTAQGDKGYIKVNSSPNVVKLIEKVVNGEKEIYNVDNYENRMVNEFIAFEKIYREKDFVRCYDILEHSKLVMEVLYEARKEAGIIFGADNKNI